MCLGDLLQLTAGFRVAWVLLLAALRRRVLFRGRPSQDVVSRSSFFEHAARVRVEQRGVLGKEAAGERALHDLHTSSGWVKKAHVHARRGHRPESGHVHPRPSRLLLGVRQTQGFV